MSNPGRTLRDLEARLHKVQAPILQGLRPGLSPADVMGMFRVAGVTPDPALVALYSWHDGAQGGGPAAELLEVARFISLQEAIALREFELLLAAENEVLPQLPAAEIFDPTWFPILDDPSGQVYVVEQFGDGRVLLIDRLHAGNPEELASSLVEFLDRIARDGLDFKPQPPSTEVERLVARFESSDDRERWSAVRELTRKRPPAAFAPLVEMLDSRDAQARREAALVLGELRDRRAIPILIRCIARWTGIDVTSAWAGLARIGKEGALGHLESALVDGDRELRIDAARGLGVSRDARAVPALKAAESGDQDPSVRAAAREALRALGDPQ